MCTKRGEQRLFNASGSAAERSPLRLTGPPREEPGQRQARRRLPREATAAGTAPSLQSN